MSSYNNCGILPVPDTEEHLGTIKICHVIKAKKAFAAALQNRIKTGTFETCLYASHSQWI